MKTIEERIEETKCWILRREGALRSANIEKVLIDMLNEQKAIDDAERDTAVYNLLQLKLDNEKKLWLDEACKFLRVVVSGWDEIAEAYFRKAMGE